MVSIPVDADQPLVSHRICNELNLGISLDYTEMTSSDIRRAVHKIFNDKSYYERLDNYSKISKQHVGYVNGANVIYDCLENKI
jgi:UDP:flavonoid glycosyltransferase YjiC (YdhE family)